MDRSNLPIQQLDLLQLELFKNGTNIKIEEENIYSSVAASLRNLTGDHCDEEDLFQCGRCKMQFTSLSLFTTHKNDHIKKDQGTTNTQHPGNSGTSVTDRNYACHDNSANKVSKKIYLIANEAINSGNEQLFNETISFESNDGYTMNDNIHINSVVGEKTINDSSLFPSSSTLVVQVPDIKMVETSMESNLQQESSTIKDYAANYQDLFHERMAKSSSSKGGKARTPTRHYCPFCNKVFAKHFDLQQHLRSHTGERPFQCIVCGRGFAQKSNLKKHMVTHKVWPDKLPGNTKDNYLLDKISTTDTSEKEQNFKECCFCGKSFDAYYDFKAHKKIHNDQKVYICIMKDCKENFSDLEPFLIHMRCHDRQMEYRCNICSVAFNSLSTLGSHQLEHSLFPTRRNGLNKLAKFPKCTECSEKFVSAEALSHHMSKSSHHFPCNHCSKICKSLRLLRLHVKIHTMKAFNCPICSKILKGPNSLKIHLRIHSNKRPFECNLCSKTFNRSDLLKRHKLLHEDKKFKCPFFFLHCKKEFYREDKLKLHLAKHVKNKGCKIKGLKKNGRRPNRRRYLRRVSNGNAKEGIQSPKSPKVKECSAATKDFKPPTSSSISSPQSNSVVSLNGRPIKKAPKSKLINSCRTLGSTYELRSDKNKPVGIIMGENSVVETHEFPHSDCMMSYTSDVDAVFKKDVDDIYFPLFSNNILQTGSDNDTGSMSDDSHCILEVPAPTNLIESYIIEPETQGVFLNPENRTLTVSVDESGTLFVERENGMPLVSPLEVLRSVILVNENDLNYQSLDESEIDLVVDL